MHKWARSGLFLEGGILLSIRHWPQWWLCDYCSPARLNRHCDFSTLSCVPEAYYSHGGQIRTLKCHELCPLNKLGWLWLHLVGTDKQVELMHSNSMAWSQQVKCTLISWIRAPEAADCVSDDGQHRGHPVDKMTNLVFENRWSGSLGDNTQNILTLEELLYNALSISLFFFFGQSLVI